MSTLNFRCTIQYSGNAEALLGPGVNRLRRASLSGVRPYQGAAGAGAAWVVVTGMKCADTCFCPEDGMAAEAKSFAAA